MMSRRPHQETRPQSLHRVFSDDVPSAFPPYARDQSAVLLKLAPLYETSLRVTSLSSSWPATNRRRFSTNIASAFGNILSDTLEECAVNATRGCDQNRLSVGSGSVWNTSRMAWTGLPASNAASKAVSSTSP